jgi:hypothetical protein
MPFQVSTIIVAPSQNAMPEANRRLANYYPRIWGDHFLTYASDHEFLINFIIVPLIVHVCI